jgi:clan AA aspartic protease
MTGYVDEYGQPKIELVVRGLQQEQSIETVVDTGFNGDLCLPIPVAVQLGLPLVAYQFIELADGSVHRDLIFSGTAIFDKKEVAAEISVTDSEEALLGTGLLKDRKLEIGFESRSLTINLEAVPSP